MLDISQITAQDLRLEPYEWAPVDDVFAPADAAALAATFPRDHFKTVTGYDGEKGYEYEARALIHMGCSATAFASHLSEPWRQLASDLVSPDYRQAIANLTKRDLNDLAIEVNVFHYGAGAWLGPHVDLKDKVVTHIFYFNESWNMEDGGILTILRSKSLDDAVATVPPVTGSSVVLVRSDRSWHAVPAIAKGSPKSRRSMTVTFYRPGSVSTMWPPGDETPLHDFADLKMEVGARGWLKRLMTRSER